jgi:hypothetical protein
MRPVESIELVAIVNTVESIELNTSVYLFEISEPSRSVKSYWGCEELAVFEEAEDTAFYKDGGSISTCKTNQMISTI